MIPMLRWLVTLQFRRALANLAAENDWKRIDIVCHSFGTHLVGWGLYGIAREKRPKVHTIIMAGSVLRPGFPWHALKPAQVQRIVNECGIHDGVLLLNQAVVLFTGMAGRIGFGGMTDEYFRNRFFPFGHSGYFMRGSGASDHFMQNRWVPLLMGEGAIPAVVDPRDPNALEGFMTFFLNNLEPIKITIYLLPFLILSTIYISLYHRADQERIIAEQEKQSAIQASHLAQDNARQARNRLVDLQVASGQRRVEEGDLPSALPFFVQAMLADSDMPEHEKEHRVRFATTRRQCPAPVQVLFTNNWYPDLAAFSPDGTRVALAGGTISTGEGAEVWDLATGDLISTYSRHDNTVHCIAFSPDGQTVVTGANDSTARLWKAGTGELVMPPLNHSAQQSDVIMTAFDPSGDRLLTVDNALDDHKYGARIWDTHTGKPLTPLMSHAQQVDFAAFSRDGSRVVTVSEDGTSQIWDSSTSKPVCPPLATGELPGIIGSRLWADFSPDGSKVATSNGESIQVWNSKTGAAITAPLKLDNAALVRFVDDTSILGVTGFGATQTWNADSGEIIHNFHRHGEGYNSGQFALAPDGREIAIGEGATVQVWDANSEKALTCPMHHSQGIQFMQFSPDGTKLLVISLDNSVRIWNLASLAATVLDRESASIASAAFSPSGKQVVTVPLSSGEAPVIDVSTGKLLFLLEHGGSINFAGFSPAGDRIVTLGDDMAACLWDAATGNATVDPLKHDKTPTVAAFSRDGRFLATAGYDDQDGLVHIWDVYSGNAFSSVPTGAQVTGLLFNAAGDSVLVAGGGAAWLYDVKTKKRITGGGLQDGYGVLAADLSLDGRRILTGGLDGVAQVWDAISGEALTPPMVHAAGPNDVNWSHRISCCVFSPDGRSILTTSDDGTARLWDSAGRPAAPPMPVVAGVGVFSPDGRWVATGGSDKLARIWLARNGVAISPPLQHGDAVTTVAFAPDGSGVLTAGSDARIWDLSPDTQPAEALQNQAELIACQRLDQTGALVSLTPDEFKAIWRRVHPSPGERKGGTSEGHFPSSHPADQPR